MVIVGDIVEIASRAAHRWVVSRIDHDGARLNRNDGERVIGFTVSPLALTVISHPLFTTGQTVKCSDCQLGTVIADPGGDSTVRVKGPDQLPIRDGEFYVTGFSGGEHDADRAHLVLDNRKV